MSKKAARLTLLGIGLYLLASFIVGYVLHTFFPIAEWSTYDNSLWSYWAGVFLNGLLCIMILAFVLCLAGLPAYGLWYLIKSAIKGK